MRPPLWQTSVWDFVLNFSAIFCLSRIRGEREFPFPVVPKNGGLWFPFPNFGNGFFHSLPVPEFREWIFFIPFPFPNFGNGFFSFPSRSRILGMVFFHSLPIPEFLNGFFHSLPVPELREWVFSIPFPFPNFWNGIIHSRSRSCTPKCHSRSPLCSDRPLKMLYLALR